MATLKKQAKKFDEAWKLISEVGKVTTSYLQRRLGIGYNLAYKIMEELEKREIIGPADSAKPRLVIKKYNQDHTLKVE